MSDVDQIALEAARTIYSINIERRGIRNKAHYISLIQEAVSEAIGQTTASYRTERDSAKDAEAVAWLELQQARQIITDLVEYAEQNDPACPHISKSKEFLACRSDK